MQTVNFETAKRLSEAGFPQPKPNFGQIFCLNNRAYLFQEQTEIGAETLEVAKLYKDRRVLYWNEIVFSRSNFVPTATDILKHLPGIALTCEGELWVVFEITTGAYRSDWQSNPAEAAAQAWFNENEKK